MRKASGFLAFLLTFSLVANATNQPTPVKAKPKAPPVFDIKQVLNPGAAGYFALSPDYSFNGPVFSEATAGQYMQEVFGLLVQAASSMASEFYKEGRHDNYTYWTFLVLALAVPHQESRLMHANLAVTGDKIPLCNPGLNELTTIKNSKMLPVLRAEYRQQSTPILPNCSVLAKLGRAEQLMISTNKSDVGLMQINAPVFIESLMPSIYMNLYNTVRFGMYHLYSKFKDIRMNLGKYDCLKPSNPFADIKNPTPAVFYNMDRGTWGGGYNIGNTLISSVCRFADSKHPQVSRDNHFRETLDSILIHQNSIFHRYLPANSRERRALDEIVYNFRAPFTAAAEKERNENVFAVTETDYFSKYMSRYSGSYRELNPTYYLTTKNLFFRAGPQKTDNICGVVHAAALDKKPSLHVEKVWDFENPYNGNKIERWAAVRLSRYANNVEFTSQDKNCIYEGRDIFFVDGNHISEVKSKDLRNVDLVGSVTQRGRTFNIRHFYSLDSSIIGKVSSGDKVNIVEIINDPVMVKKEDGSLKSSPRKWYKIIVPGQPNQFGYVEESAIESVSERS